MEHKQIADTAKALAHPARIAILEFLANQKSCFCGDIVAHLPLAQSTISQHLKVLKKTGLITGKIEGTSVCYCIDINNWKQAKTLFQNFFTQLKERCC